MPTHARKRNAFSLALTAALTVGALAVPARVAPPALALEYGFTPAPPAAHAAGVVSQAAAAPAPFPYTDTFKLHSYPGAQRVIYLDFNGETITGTAWNNDYGATIAAVAFDTDGNPAVFSNGELDIIQSAWQRVAEDYAPMAVDVTTEDPGLAAIDRTNEADTAYGTRALVTSMSTIYSTCGCSGVSFVGAFNISGVHQTYQPAFILSKALGANDKDLGDVISHEVGHSLGLNHDGNASSGYYFGQGAWAPLMGAGFYHPVTQFSKGDYNGANNTEDDFAVMAQHGAATRTDDYGDAISVASPLGGSLSAKGVISSDADVDVFSFDASGGSVSFTATPAPRGPNLDIKLELLDGNGAVLSSADPASAMPNGSNYDYVTGLNAGVSASVGAGTYYLRVQGVGAGDPKATGYSGYGSVGNYTISAASVPTSTPPNLSVSDATVDEGNSGTSNVAFTLSLSAPSTSPVTVTASTADGTGVAGSDYTATSGTVTIPAGQTNATFSVPATGDLTPEANDKFTLALSNPSGATVTDGTGVGTLRNDDGVAITISDVSKSEGASGHITTFTFTVTLSKITTVPIGVTVSTAAGSAVGGGSDFYAKSQVLSFAAGQKSKTFSISVKGDGVHENTEKFYVNLSNPTGTGAKILDAQGVGTILNDD